MSKFRQRRRQRDAWTEDERRMHTFFPKVYAIGVLLLMAVAAIIWFVARYFF